MPLNFPGVTGGDSRAIATYSFFDIAAGIAYVDLHGGILMNNFVSGATLSVNDFFSEYVFSEGKTQATTGAYMEFLSGTFAIKFESPIVLEGAAIVNMPHGIHPTSTPEAVGNQVHVILEKSGSTLSTIGTASGALFEYQAQYSGDQRFIYEPILVDLPLTSIAKDEYLNVRYKIYTKTGTNSGSTCFLAHDPQNRSTNWRNRGINISSISAAAIANGEFSTDLLVQIPVKVDI